MVRRSSRKNWPQILWIWGALLLIGVGTSCGSPSVRTQEELVAVRLLTMQPEMALTLTAWPTSPPLVTRPPTPTAAPQPLWTVEPQESATQTPVATSLPETRPVGGAPVMAAPLGSRPPAAKLLIPSLGLSVSVVEVGWEAQFDGEVWHSVWQTADGAAGHHRNSANPGEAGNVVISGHHNARGEVFREVSEIGEPYSRFGPGNEIILVAQDGRRYSYIVIDWKRFQEEGIAIEERRRHASYLAQTEEPRLTLVTCWPYEGNSHRVLVIAELVQ